MDHKVHQDKRVINKAIYLALGITEEGQKDLLGLWISENEGSKFWLSVLTELQNRGLKDVFIFSVDGLTGFPQAISAAFPKSKVQLCIVHMVRNSLRYVPSKDMKAVAQDLKSIYGSTTLTEAEKALEEFVPSGLQSILILKSLGVGIGTISSLFSIIRMKSERFFIPQTP